MKELLLLNIEESERSMQDYGKRSAGKFAFVTSSRNM